MKQYLDLCERILTEGRWVKHARSGTRRLTVLNVDLEYECSTGRLPVLTTKKVAWVPAIAEMLGYVRGYSSAAQFREIGTNTWNANANENKEWLANPYRTGEDDMGRVYGVQGRAWQKPDGSKVDQLKLIYDKLRSSGEDDGRLILTFHNPGELDMGCLPACMHTHTFSVVDRTLYLTSYQRSCDVPLGLPFNMIQAAWLLRIMAEITHLQPGKVYHKIVNAHIYENQIEGIREQLKREPYESPILNINPLVGSLGDVETWLSVKGDHDLLNYKHHPAIKFPFTV
jgi:thymidylate synthase